ncbi:FtsW/RodA/SpoVE family cell cycle protein, partial [Pseudomonas aeruginosa]|uniref:FtsW/RodA/SpoVE family cell cycle protein n=1 Tax=Pseudomonas aeruginosa TaxID=287 RepID=UPI00211AF723
MRRRASLLQRLHIDGILLLLLLILGATGLFVLYSASGKSWDMLMKQATSFGLGLGMMVVIAQIEPRFMARWVPLGYLVGVALLVVVDVIGHDAKGATRWINIPGVIRFQPSEFMKLLMPMTVAWYLSKRNLPPGLKHMVISLAIIITPFVLILKQPDLGTAADTAPTIQRQRRPPTNSTKPPEARISMAVPRSGGCRISPNG